MGRAGRRRALAQIERCARTADHVALMADHHKGYAVPIGGVVAYADKVSPSGVGYDIACLAEGTLLTTASGEQIPIEAVHTELLGMGRDGEICNVGAPLTLATKQSDTLQISLTSGDRLILTPDHMLYTPNGWIPAGNLEIGDLVAVSSFVGMQSCGIWKNDYRFARLVGLAMGDGHLTSDGNRVSFYTSKDEDVPTIVSDLAALGYAAKVHQRQHNGANENQIYLNSRVLYAAFASAGVPIGKKVFRVADMGWVLHEADFIKAAWLGGLFSAEMSAPQSMPTQIGNPALKQGGLAPMPLLQIVGEILESWKFQVSIQPSGKNERQVYVLQVLGGQNEAVRLWRTIGFPYAKYKRRKAAEAMSVAWQRNADILRRQTVRDAIKALRNSGVGVYDLAPRATEQLKIKVTHSMALKALYLNRGKPRTTKRFEPQACDEVAWASVLSINASGNRKVYDIPLTSPLHNFIANGVIAHNCGNKAVLTDLTGADVRPEIKPIMDSIWKTISFGVGRNNNERADHALFDDPAWRMRPLRPLKQMAANQLGTVGSGNHYVDLLLDETDRLWIGVHFGSRGLGHKTATYFLQAGGASDGMDVDPLVLDANGPLGADYLACMELVGRYAYAGRDWVCARVASLIGAKIVDEVHNHHNFAWRETHGGQALWVIRKGATPAFPGQRGFIGGSMGDTAVIVEGIENTFAADSLYSTVHGAGRVMSRNAARGKINRKTGAVISPGAISTDAMLEWVQRVGVELRGAGTDEAPQAYKRLPEVLAQHAGTIRILHTLTPIGVAMAGVNEFDPYKD